jgi:hypothetical protein
VTAGPGLAWILVHVARHEIRSSFPPACLQPTQLRVHCVVKAYVAIPGVLVVAWSREVNVRCALLVLSPSRTGLTKLSSRLFLRFRLPRSPKLQWTSVFLRPPSAGRYLPGGFHPSRSGKISSSTWIIWRKSRNKLSFHCSCNEYWISPFSLRRSKTASCLARSRMGGTPANFARRSTIGRM